MSAPDTDTDTNAAPAMSSEQSADLAALHAAAQGAPVEPVAQEQDSGPPQPTAQAMGVAGLLVGIVQPVLTQTVAGLKDASVELWKPVVESVAGLLDHYGLASEVLAGPWARFGFSIAPLAGIAIMANMQAKRDKPEQLSQDGPELSAAAPVGPVGSKTVTFGAAA